MGPARQPRAPTCVLTVQARTAHALFNSRKHPALHAARAVNPFAMHFVFEGLSHLNGRETTVWSPTTDVGTVALLILPALLVVASLSTPAARRLLWPLVEPPLNCFFTRAHELASKEAVAVHGAAV